MKALLKYKKALWAIAGAASLTVAWLIDSSTVPTAVVAGAWVVTAGVFGAKNHL